MIIISSIKKYIYKMNKMSYLENGNTHFNLLLECKILRILNVLIKFPIRKY